MSATLLPLTPPRQRGHEILDDPDVDPAIVRRSLADVALSNRLFGGTRAVLAELQPVFRRAGAGAALTLLDVGSGAGDIPERARSMAADCGVRLTTIALDAAEVLAAPARRRGALPVCADARRLPLADGAVDVVCCSQVLHHFADDEAAVVVRELTRVARKQVVISDLRRSWMAAGGIWTASWALGFHPVSRHDGVVSVFRGFTPAELAALVRQATGHAPTVRRRAGFRITACWQPSA